MVGLSSPSNRSADFDPCHLQWLIMFTSSTIRQIQHGMVMNISHGDLGRNYINKLLIRAKIFCVQWPHLSGLLEASHSSSCF